MTVYVNTDIWGDPVQFDTIEALEDAIREVCLRNPADFQFPEDGLREGRDYEEMEA